MVSFVPGLGIVILGKRNLGLSVTLVVTLLFALFWFVPTMITWFIFGIAVIAQMAFAVGLTTIRNTASTISVDSKLAHPLPAKFSDKKQIAPEVMISLSSILRSGEQLKTAIVGLQQDSSQFMFVGVTQEYLVLAQCNQSGNPSDLYHILNDDVTWVSLRIAKHILFLTIKYESGKILTLHVPATLKKQARLIVNEFPGTWSEEIPGRWSNEPTEGFWSILKERYFSSEIIFAVLGIAILFGLMYLTTDLEQPYKAIVLQLAGSMLFFLTGWPQFVSLARQFKKEPGITFDNVFASFYILAILFIWSFSLYLAGMGTIVLVKFIQNTG